MYHKNTKKINSTNILVKDCITTALFQLLTCKEFEKISITDIVNKAGVSRMSYYRNFESKEDIIMCYIYDKFLETVNEVKKKRPLNLTLQNVLYKSLVVFKRNAEAIKLLLENNLDMLLYTCYEKAFEYFFPELIKSKTRYFFYRLLVGNVFTIEIAWIKGGMKETPEELTNIYTKLIPIIYKS